MIKIISAFTPEGLSGKISEFTSKNKIEIVSTSLVVVTSPPGDPGKFYYTIAIAYKQTL